MKYLILDGVRHEWKKIRQLRREQIQAARRQHPTLFVLREDTRPASQQNADGRYAEPLLPLSPPDTFQ